MKLKNIFIVILLFNKAIIGQQINGQSTERIELQNQIGKVWEVASNGQSVKIHINPDAKRPYTDSIIFSKNGDNISELKVVKVSFTYLDAKIISGKIDKNDLVFKDKIKIITMPDKKETTAPVEGYWKHSGNVFLGLGASHYYRKDGNPFTTYGLTWEKNYGPFIGGHGSIKYGQIKVNGVSRSIVQIPDPYTGIYYGTISFMFKVIFFPLLKSFTFPTLAWITDGFYMNIHIGQNIIIKPYYGTHIITAFPVSDWPKKDFVSGMAGEAGLKVTAIAFRNFGITFEMSWLTYFGTGEFGYFDPTRGYKKYSMLLVHRFGY